MSDVYFSTLLQYEEVTFATPVQGYVSMLGQMNNSSYAQNSFLHQAKAWKLKEYK